MNYNLLTRKDLVKKFELLGLNLPEKGSGKNGGILKSDLISVLKSNTKKEEFSDMSSDMMNLIAYKLSGKDLISFCQTNKKFTKVCVKEDFWAKKYKLDYGEIPKQLSIRQLYTFKAQKNSELIKYLLENTNYNDLNLYKQRKLYFEALSEFKSFIFNYEEVNDDEWDMYNIKINILYKMKELLYGDIHFLSDFGREGLLHESFEEDFYDNKDFFKEVLSISNSITGLSLTYNEAYKIVNND